MNTAAAGGIRELARATTPAIREMLADISLGLTHQAAFAAPKVFQLKRQLGEREVVKLVVMILRAFVDSLRVPDKPDAADLLEVADTLVATYTHDSLKDFILALKEARTKGTKFYQSLDVSTLYRIIREYFDKKAAYLESGHLDRKATGAGQQAQVVKLLGEAAPRLLQNVAQQIPASHPNAESLRTALTITNGRARHGLITPQEAEAQRAAIRKATERKARPDWKPSAEAQQRIDKANAAEDRAIMEKYGTPNQ